MAFQKKKLVYFPFHTGSSLENIMLFCLISGNPQLMFTKAVSVNIFTYSGQQFSHFFSPKAVYIC